MSQLNLEQQGPDLWTQFESVPHMKTQILKHGRADRLSPLQLQNLTLRPPAPGALTIPPSLRLKSSSLAPPPLSRPHTPLFPPLRPRPPPSTTATESLTMPSRHLSVPPPSKTQRTCIQMTDALSHVHVYACDQQEFTVCCIENKHLFCSKSSQADEGSTNTNT